MSLKLEDEIFFVAVIFHETQHYALKMYMIILPIPVPLDRLYMEVLHIMQSFQEIIC